MGIKTSAYICNIFHQKIIQSSQRLLVGLYSLEKRLQPEQLKIRGSSVIHSASVEQNLNNLSNDRLLKTCITDSYTKIKIISGRCWEIDEFKIYNRTARHCKLQNLTVEYH